MTTATWTCHSCGHRRAVRSAHHAANTARYHNRVCPGVPGELWIKGEAFRAVFGVQA